MKPFLLIFAFFPFFQGKSPVSWSSTSQRLTSSEYNLVFTATIEDGWNIYSQYLESEDGPVKTSFSFDDKNNIQLIGKNVESGDIKKVKDEMFDMEVIKIKHKGVFTQKVKIKAISKPITGTIEYMCCNDMQCLPPKSVPFSISLATAQ